MTNIRLVVVAGAVVMFFSACLGEGAQCQPEDGAVCEDPTTALYCENGVLAKYKCAGELGCTANAQTKAVLCDFRGTEQFQPCPRLASKQDLAICFSNPAGTVLLKCTPFQGAFAWQSAANCSSCTTSGLNATCKP